MQCRAVRRWVWKLVGSFRLGTAGLLRNEEKKEWMKYNGKIIRKSCARVKLATAQISLPFLFYSTTTPLHDKQHSPSWSQWSVCLSLLPLRCHDVIMSKSCEPSKSSKTRTQKCIYSKNMVLGTEKWFNMTAVIILVIPLIIFEYGSL